MQENKHIANETYLSRINDADARYILTNYYTVGNLLDPIKKETKKYAAERKQLGDRLVPSSTLVNKYIHNIVVTRYQKNDITYKVMVSKVLEVNAKRYLELCGSAAPVIEWDKITESQCDELLQEVIKSGDENIDLWLLIIVLKAEGIIKESDYAYALLRGSARWLTTKNELLEEKEKALEEQQKKLEKDHEKDAKTQTKDLEKKLKEAEDELKKIEAREDSWGKKLEKKENDLNAADAKVKEQKDIISQLKKDNTKMFDVITNLESDNIKLKESAEKERKEREIEISRLNSVISELKTELKACSTESRAIKKLAKDTTKEEYIEISSEDYGVYIENPSTIEDILRNEEYLERRGKAILKK